MKKYNLEYFANGQIIKMKNITMAQAEEFIKGLPSVNESSLILKEVKEIDEEERWVIKKQKKDLLKYMEMNVL